MATLTFTESFINLFNQFNGRIYAKLEFEAYEEEINYHNCRVEILNDDFRTIWVKWGKYDCKLIDLPALSLATVIDNLLK